MVGHKHVSVDGLAIALWSFFQPAEVGAVVLPVVEDRLAIIAALDDMRRHVSGHCHSQSSQVGGPARPRAPPGAQMAALEGDRSKAGARFPHPG